MYEQNTNEKPTLISGPNTGFKISGKPTILVDTKSHSQVSTSYLSFENPKYSSRSRVRSVPMISYLILQPAEGFIYRQLYE